MSPKQLRGNAFSIVAAAVVATACRSSAQPPPPETASQQKSSPEARTAADQRSKPQIIYNLGSASREMAEVLHSQSKPADNSLPVDPSMPISLQVARAKANAAAADQKPARALEQTQPRERKAHRASHARTGPAPLPAIGEGPPQRGEKHGHKH